MRLIFLALWGSVVLWGYEYNFERLGLTPEQSSQFEILLKKRHYEKKQFMKQNYHVHEEEEALFRSATFDKKGLLRLKEEQCRLRTESELNFLEEVHRLLNPLQRKTFFEIYEKGMKR